ncbi:UNVERIFIED_CONTAM: hypothetical protein HDU68_006477 [Siphonaria sp. JEL0065]|nr:hypothetical protein HDU68_006477 [Siphonaria sp. JEL0065]
MTCCFGTLNSHRVDTTKVQLSFQIPAPQKLDAQNVPYMKFEDSKPLSTKDIGNASTMTSEEIQAALIALKGKISYERIERYVFNSDYCPKDIQSRYIDVVAREVYKRDIIKNRGAFDHDGLRIKRWPPKKKHWEAIIRYLGTLIVERDEPYQQSEVLAIINYFLPSGGSGNHGGVSPTVFVTNMVAMGILEREMGGSGIWRRRNTKHPMPLGAGILPNF